MNLNNYMQNNKSFYFYIIDFENDFSDMDAIIKVFTDCLTDSCCFLANEYYIILYQNGGLEDEAVLNAIYDDFSRNIKIFKSCKIYNPDDFNHLVALATKSLKSKSRLLTTIRLLTTDIIEDANNENIRSLKEIIMKKVLEDNKLKEIINGMFVNNLNVSKTASYVYMHRNTINNKIDFITKETTLDIQKFYDATIIYMLMKCK